MRRFFELLLLAVAFCFTACKDNSQGHSDTLFKSISPDSSGIDFVNTISVNDTTNILNYEYLYNGAGVGIGDFNNDHLPDIFFTGNMVPCTLYLNKGKFKFQDITSSSGIDTKGVWAYGVSLVDINQDGWQDIYVSAGGIGNKDAFPNKLFINQHDLTFKESAAAYGLADSGESIQAAFFDYDRDGDLDMYLLTGGGFEKPATIPRPIVEDGTGRNTDRLYRNDFNVKLGHAVFTNVSKQANIVEEGFGLGVSIIDVNNDGWPDVYVTDDYLSNDLLYVNNQDGTFREKSASYLKHTSHFAMGNDVGDINNDGLFDIVAVDMLPEDHYRRKLMFGPSQYDRFYASVALGYSYQYMRNTLQLNNGNGSFSEIGQMAGIYKTDWSWAPLFADFDNDGYQDLFITNGFGKDVTDLDFVKFRTESMSSMNRETMRKAFEDSLDARPGIRKPNYVYKNKGDLTFEKKTDPWGFAEPSLSNGAAYADFDLDGDLDLVINNLNDKAFVYKNTLVDRALGNTNYLEVELQGPDQNRTGIGATVQLDYNNQKQVRLQSLTRGFESSVDPTVHFGLGKVPVVDKITVVWSDGRISELPSVKSNQRVRIDYQNSHQIEKNDKTIASKYFQAVPDKMISYRHRENDFNDFSYEPLLPHKLSQEGPGIAVGDIDGDDLDDVYIGGSYHHAGRFLMQQKNGVFKHRTFLSPDSLSDDTGCLFFDADQDGDLDLYVVSGGSEYRKQHDHYSDRLYKNDGKGNFNRDDSALPKMLESGSCVITADYDQDGDLDLFVAGRVTPHEYPVAPSSYILENDHGRFADVTDRVAPGLKNIGMVTGALWSDVDNDHDLDLLLVGEWMPVTVFKNQQAHFSKDQSGLQDTEGMWNSLTAGDFDDDGDVDYIAGNLGLNTPLKASVKEPMSIHYADFDKNGSVDAITCYYEEGASYPFPALDDLTKQLPVLKKHILFYRNYARASKEDLLAMTGDKEASVLTCKILETSLIENAGNGKFKIRPLPKAVQIAPVTGVMAEDVNADGNLDLIVVGNSYSTEVVTGRYDAMIGAVLLGDGKNNFTDTAPATSGFFVNGDAKGIARVDAGKNSSYVLVAQNNDSLRTFQFTKKTNHESIKRNPHEVYAILTLENGKKRKIELNGSGTYLSQSSQSVLITPQVKTIEFFNAGGKALRALKVGDLRNRLRKYGSKAGSEN